MHLDINNNFAEKIKAYFFFYIENIFNWKCIKENKNNNKINYLFFI